MKYILVIIGLASMHSLFAQELKEKTQLNHEEVQRIQSYEQYKKSLEEDNQVRKKQYILELKQNIQLDQQMIQYYRSHGYSYDSEPILSYLRRIEMIENKIIRLNSEINP